MGSMRQYEYYPRGGCLLVCQHPNLEQRKQIGARWGRWRGTSIASKPDRGLVWVLAQREERRPGSREASRDLGGAL